LAPGLLVHFNLLKKTGSPNTLDFSIRRPASVLLVEPLPEPIAGTNKGKRNFQKNTPEQTIQEDLLCITITDRLDQKY
jgi:hypothetical protein